MFEKRSKPDAAKDAQSAPKAPTPAEASAKRCRLLSGIAAAGCAVALGAVVLCAVTMSQSSSELSAARSQSAPVLVAAHPMERGAVVAPADVRVEQVPSAFVGAGTLTSPEQAVGKTLAQGVAQNAQVPADAVAGGSQASTLAAALSPGHVAASVSVDASSGVAGLLRQGDRVDVLAEGQAAIQGVRVLALDASLDSHGSEYATVTLELTLEQALALQSESANSGQTGQVRLVLNSAADSPEHPTDTKGE